uniref:Tankyrase n=1 Tax=Chelonoidis abingdonii TaxID=106734 RepID=A0A8C0J5R0_CHEAB
FGRKDVVEHLLQTGANVHARDDGGLIPLHNACSFGHAEVVSLLLCQGADPNARDNWNYTPLHEAAIKGKIDVTLLLVSIGMLEKSLDSSRTLLCAGSNQSNEKEEASFLLLRYSLVHGYSGTLCMRLQ